MKPLISVIVPVYKVEPYLRKCVDSILNQTYTNLEVILVDDGSPDNCGAICDEYARKDSRVRVIHKENGGQATARNAALEIASGEYVAFVDGDDWLDVLLYENVICHAPFDAALFGCTYVEEKSGKCVKRIACEKPEILVWKDGSKKTEELVLNSLFGYACNKVYSRAVIGDIRMPDALLREDLLFNMQVFAETEWIQLVDCTGYFYVQHEGSTLSKGYSGPVPDIGAVAEQMQVVHPQLPDIINRKLANGFIKQYICDAVYKFVFQNEKLTEEARIQELDQFFRNIKVPKILKAYPDDGGLFILLDLCVRMRAPNLFYRIMRRKWNG